METEKKTTYKFLPVSEETHKQFKILCVENQGTFDETLRFLINFYKANT
jgi:hypothetical protein